MGKFKAKSKARIIINVIVNVILVLLILIFIGRMIFLSRYQSVYVIGDSMRVTLIGASNEKSPGGDYVYIDKKRTAERGDIVLIQVYKDEEKGVTESKVIIKRVLGVAGDTVEFKKGVYYLNGEAQTENYVHPVNNTKRLDMDAVTVMEGKIFFAGDNRNVSKDMRNDYANITNYKVLGVVPEWALKYKYEITQYRTFIDFTLKLNIIKN